MDKIYNDYLTLLILPSADDKAMRIYQGAIEFYNRFFNSIKQALEFEMEEMQNVGS